jgi:hypothetical protein
VQYSLRKESSRQLGPASRKGWEFVADASVRSALGNKTDAISILRSVQAEAEKCGLPEYELESRLALGKIELLDGKTASAKPRLEILEKDARKKRFRLIRSQAALARSAS